MTRPCRWLAPMATRLMVGLAFLSMTFVADAAQPNTKPRPQPRPAPAPPSNAPSGAIPVTVVETAGTRAYVRPGASEGVRRGAIVTIFGKEYRVVDSTDSFAVIDIGDEPLREQERGSSTLVAQEQQKPVELPRPRPLDTWRHAWAPEAAPADSQEPRFVPLGDAERNRRFDVRFTLAAGGLIPLGGQVGSSLGEAELNVRLHAEPFAAPIALDLDASLQGWTAADLGTRVGASTRPFLYGRELLASVTLGSVYAGLGRMRYAASTLGTLDGARVASGIGQ